MNARIFNPQRLVTFFKQLKSMSSHQEVKTLTSQHYPFEPPVPRPRHGEEKREEGAKAIHPIHIMEKKEERRKREHFFLFLCFIQS